MLLHRKLESWTTHTISAPVGVEFRGREGTFRNRARAKQTSCRCPADMDEPPSLTTVSSPPVSDMNSLSFA